MYRIHPTTENKCHARGTEKSTCPSVLTVWKKSSMTFQGTDGFCVYDSTGKMVFRVDNYSRRNRCTTRGLVLMDGSGKPLMTMKPQILSMHEQWNGFQGDDSSKTNPKAPVFSMRRRSIIQSSDEAEVFMWGSIIGVMAPDFRIDGCFRSRHCKIRDCNGEVAAEISRKKANTTLLLSDDVFSLIIRPGYECDLIMAFVVIMDRICRKPFAPILCS